MTLLSSNFFSSILPRYENNHLFNSTAIDFFEGEQGHERHFLCFRQTVRDIINILEPERSARLKKGRLSRRIYSVKGPNQMWHVDGNDKLKPYGFEIHGCIDGYSRKLLWLEVGTSNKNPTIILNYYVNTIRDIQLVPTLLRCDRGTENFLTGDVQRLFRSDHDDEQASIATIYGRSTHNQRIKFFWSHLKKSLLQVYIDLFKDMEAIGLIDRSDEFVMDALSFCFMEIIRADLRQALKEWNSHDIRKNKMSELPCGAPNFLFKYPAYHGYQQMGKAFNDNYMPECLKMCHSNPLMAINYDFHEWALNLMLVKNWHLP